MTKNKIIAVVERIDDGYTGYIQAKSGLITGFGETISELKKSLEEGLKNHIEEAKSEKIETNDIENRRLELSLDVGQIFEYFDTINQTAFARRIGMNRSMLNMFITGRRTPSERSSLRIIDGIRSLGKDYISI